MAILNYIQIVQPQKRSYAILSLLLVLQIPTYTTPLTLDSYIYIRKIKRRRIYIIYLPLYRKTWYTKTRRARMCPYIHAPARTIGRNIKNALYSNTIGQLMHRLAATNLTLISIKLRKNFVKKFRQYSTRLPITIYTQVTGQKLHLRFYISKNEYQRRLRTDRSQSRRLSATIHIDRSLYIRLPLSSISVI